MIVDSNDTIVAQATPLGRGGVGILRISGNKAQDVAKAVLHKLPEPRYADYLAFKNVDNSILDYGIALWFPKPNSFTGEDTLELHSHGGQVILEMLLKRILLISSNIRIAKPGEFSERAFLNNKIDLIQAEALLGLINADSKRAARLAINSFQSVLSVQINQLVDKIINLRVKIEASIDFPEEKIFLPKEEVITQLNDIVNNLIKLRIKASQSNTLQGEIKVVIAGSPNVGKSSLLNNLIGYETAIVTSIAGTTRDVLRQCIYVDGMPINVIDTAGLHDPNDEIERIGIERAWIEIKQANHILLLVDGNIIDSSKDIINIYRDFTAKLPKNNTPITIIRNKIDLTKEDPDSYNINNLPVICLSAITGNGVDILRDHLRKHLKLDADVEGNFLVHQRHLQALEKTNTHLMKGKAILMNRDYISTIELLAEELSLAQQTLNEITGKFKSDDLLNQIFSNFCIGK